jgi:hypothetical protein
MNTIPETNTTSASLEEVENVVKFLCMNTDDGSMAVGDELSDHSQEIDSLHPTQVNGIPVPDAVTESDPWYDITFENISIAPRWIDTVRVLRDTFDSLLIRVITSHKKMNETRFSSPREREPIHLDGAIDCPRGHIINTESETPGSETPLAEISPRSQEFVEQLSQAVLSTDEVQTNPEDEAVDNLFQAVSCNEGELAFAESFPLVYEGV